MGVVFLCGTLFIGLFLAFFVGFFIGLNDVYIIEQQKPQKPATEYLIREQEPQDDSFVYTSMWLDID